MSSTLIQITVLIDEIYLMKKTTFFLTQGWFFHFLGYINPINIIHVMRTRKSLNYLETGSFWFKYINSFISTIERPNWYASSIRLIHS